MKFYVGAIDGQITSDSSKQAIKNFQGVYGLTETGSLNEVTRDKLDSVYAFYCNTCADPDIQSLASSLGLDSV